jgi:hypothetical protein
MAAEGTSEQIIAIRLRAGWDGWTCPTCCKDLPVAVPRVHGCIDACHTRAERAQGLHEGYLVPLAKQRKGATP